MMNSDREVIEGRQFQGEDEIIAYTLDVGAIAQAIGVPTSPVVVVKDVAAGSVVTSTVMPLNVPTVDGSVITLSPLRALTAGRLYRVEVKYVVEANTLESYFYVQAQE
jgi:hypothetical protein